MRTEASKKLARLLRHNATEAETRLWSLLRHKRLQPYRFRRQYPIGPFIADFACLSHRLVIEADGSQHMNSPTDTQRTAFLEKSGWKVVRFWNSDILSSTESVLDAIWDALQGRENAGIYNPLLIQIVRDHLS